MLFFFWNVKNCLNSHSLSRYYLNVTPDANSYFFLRREPRSWTDSESFRSLFRTLSSACVKDTGWLSFSGLYAPFLTSKVMSLCSESELYSLLPSVSGHERFVLRQRELRGIEQDACSCELFLLDLSCRNSSLQCDPFFSTRFEWQMTYSSFYQVLLRTWGVNSLSLIP